MPPNFKKKEKQQQQTNKSYKSSPSQGSVFLYLFIDPGSSIVFATNRPSISLLEFLNRYYWGQDNSKFSKD